MIASIIFLIHFTAYQQNLSLDDILSLQKLDYIRVNSFLQFKNTSWKFNETGLDWDFFGYKFYEWQTENSYDNLNLFVKDGYENAIKITTRNQYWFEKIKNVIEDENTKWKFVGTTSNNDNGSLTNIFTQGYYIISLIEFPSYGYFTISLFNNNDIEICKQDPKLSDFLKADSIVKASYSSKMNPPLPDPSFPIKYYSNRYRGVTEQMLIREEGNPSIIVDEMPSFPGGTSKLRQFITETLTQTFSNSDNRSKCGTVTISIIIDKDGKISNILPLFDQTGQCIKEAIKIINSMPNWNVGRQNGLPVSVLFDLRIAFN